MLTDTSGAAFGWDCDAAGCRLRVLPQTPTLPTCASDETPIYTYSVGQFVAVAAACARSDGSWSTESILERPVGCVTDEDCPQLYQFVNVYRFACHAGVCENVDLERFPRQAITRDEASLLCYATIARDQTLRLDSSASIEAAARVDQVCPSDLVNPCRLPLPDGCLQP